MRYTITIAIQTTYFMDFKKAGYYMTSNFYEHKSSMGLLETIGT